MDTDHLLCGPRAALASPGLQGFVCEKEELAYKVHCSSAVMFTTSKSLSLYVKRDEEMSSGLTVQENEEDLDEMFSFHACV